MESEVTLPRGSQRHTIWYSKSMQKTTTQKKKIKKKKSIYTRKMIYLFIYYLEVYFIFMKGKEIIEKSYSSQKCVS